MTTNNIVQIAITPLVTNQIVAIDSENNPIITSYKEWVLNNAANLPPFYSEDHVYIADRCYQQYINQHQCAFENHQHNILLVKNVQPNNVVINEVFLTLKTTHFNGHIELVLAQDDCEVCVASLGNIHLIEPIMPAHKTRKLELIAALKNKLNKVSLNTGQAVYLNVVGGLIITDNILVATTSTST